MPDRTDLQAFLELLLESRNVYFQPPASIMMKYPCIVYSRNSEKKLYANDNPYHQRPEYQVIVIDPDPDSIILGKMSALPMCSWIRQYTKDNLYHTVYNLYY